MRLVQSIVYETSLYLAMDLYSILVSRKIWYKQNTSFDPIPTSVWAIEPSADPWMWITGKYYHWKPLQELRQHSLTTNKVVNFFQLMTSWLLVMIITHNHKSKANLNGNWNGRRTYIFAEINAKLQCQIQPRLVTLEVLSSPCITLWHHQSLLVMNRSIVTQ